MKNASDRTLVEKKHEEKLNETQILVNFFKILPIMMNKF